MRRTVYTEKSSVYLESRAFAKGVQRRRQKDKGCRYCSEGMAGVKQVLSGKDPLRDMEMEP